MATTSERLNGQLAGLKGGRRRWQLDPDGALRMARQGSAAFLRRFRTPEERSEYFRELVRKRWHKTTTTTSVSGEGGPVPPPSPGTPSAAADGGEA